MLVLWFVVVVRYTIVARCASVMWCSVVAWSMVVVWLTIVVKTTPARRTTVTRRITDTGRATVTGRTTPAGRTTHAWRITGEEDAVATRDSVHSRNVFLRYFWEGDCCVMCPGGEVERDSVSTRAQSGLRGAPKRRIARRREIQRPVAGGTIHAHISPSVGAGSGGGGTEDAVQCRGPCSAVQDAAQQCSEVQGWASHSLLYSI